MSHLAIETVENNIRVVTVDAPNATVNKLSSAFFDEVEAMIAHMESDSSVKGLVIISGKKDNFVAGADLDEIRAMETRRNAEAYVQRGNALLSRLEAWEKPVVCAINGSCMGGGLELALACDYRIASDSPKTVFALPEVKLGLFPAGGGTQRLPRLIGLPEALPLILTGKQVRVKKAEKIGLVDEVVHPFALKEAAVANACALSDKKRKRKPVKRSLLNRWLGKGALGRKLVFHQAQKGVLRQTRGLYPAPLEIIDSVRYGMDKGMAPGLKADIKRFGKLVFSKEAKALTRLFFAMNNAGRPFLNGNAGTVSKLAVLGAGLMGHGIAGVSADIVDTILLKDVSLEGAARGIREVQKGLSIRAKSGAITPFEKDTLAAKMIPSKDYSAFRGTDLVIEAVFEDLELKKKILKDVEEATDPETIFASNTSSLPIGEITKGCKRPENVIGMHYFSPVRSMPLLEIIITDKTADRVLETALDFGMKQGKTCIVVKDGPAFYTTRILTLMMNEAMLLVEEGVGVETIDDAMTRFGYPVGPITLADEVGIDVGIHVGEVMQPSAEKRGIEMATVLKTLHDKGFMGRKNRKGFYEYPRKKRGKKPVNKEVARILGIRKNPKPDITEIQQRVSLAMVNEAMLCLEEGIIRSPEDGDLGAILGLGFPPFRGGPFRYVDHERPETILSAMDALEKKYGARFKPAGILKEKAGKKQLFYS